MKADILKSLCAVVGLVLVTGAPDVVRADKRESAAPFPAVATTADKRELIGGWLEGRFQSMVASCTNNPVGAVGLKARSLFGGPNSGGVSVVPIQVQNFYRLQRDPAQVSDSDQITGIYKLGSQTLKSLFSIVDTSDTPMTTIDRDHVPEIGIAALSLAQLPSGLNEPLPQFNGAGYSMSCANAFSFAYKFDAKYKVVPVGAIGAALDGGVSGTANNNLRLNAGVFYSPYVAMWTGQYTTYDSKSLAETGTQTFGVNDKGALKTLVGALFWQWYLDHADKADAGNYILKYFSGVATSEEQIASSKDSTKAEVSAELTVPVVSASAKAAFDTKRETSFWSRTFSLAAYRDGRALHAGSAYYRLPTPAVIAEEVKSITLQPSSAEPIALNAVGVTELYQDAYGLQPGCEWGWTLQSSSGKPQGLTLVSAKADRDGQGIPVCRFRLSYSPSDSAKREGAQVDFDVVSTRQVTTSTGKVSFALTGAPVRVRPLAPGYWVRQTMGPQGPVDETGKPPSATSRKLVWKFEFQFDPGETGMAKPTSWALFDKRPVTCDGSRDAVTVINSALSERDDADLGYVLTVTLEAGIPVGATLFSPPEAAECRFSAKLRFGPPGSQPTVDPLVVSSLSLVYPLLAKAP